VQAVGIVYAAALVVAVSGCLSGPEASSGTACATFAECLFTQDGALEVLVHSSPGMPFPQAGLAALAGQVAELAGRTVAVANGSAVGPLPAQANDTDLRSIRVDAMAGRLDVYVLDTTRLEGDQPTSGLSFPGSPTVFLFPATLDLRVEQAGFAGAEAQSVRGTLEAVVLVHEFGHALGLVGCGIPMQVQHADPASACHSANATSLMHSKIARVAQWPDWDPAAAFGPFAWDRDDLADLAAFRESVRRDG
jgi:hypothetical protein